MFRMKSLHRAALAAAFVALAGAASAIPSTISISGRIDGTSARSVDGTFTAQIDFYETQDSTVVVATRSTTVSVTSGVFSSSITVPDTILAFDSLFYTVSIDLDEDGIDADDLFEDRFEVTSVPYSLGAPPAPLFMTTPVQQFPTIPAELTNDIQVVDFFTPPGGLRFTHLSLANVVTGNPPSATFSFGIYDDTGAILAGPVQVTVNGNRVWTITDQEIPEVVLPPNKRCYAAFATSHTGVRVPSSFGTSIPFGRGFVPDGAPGGVLPNSFNPGQVVVNADPTTGIYPSIALFTPPPPPPGP